MSRPAIAEINFTALRHNLRQVRRLAPQSAVIAMIKANAYGHGFKQIARALPDVEAFGVACIEEALQLREIGVMQPILLMEGFFTVEELPIIAQHNFHVVVHNFVQVNILNQIQLAKPLTVWLKVDSGMHRLGFLPEEAKVAWQHLNRCKAVHEIHLMTHLARPEDVMDNVTPLQVQCFQELVQNWPGKRSAANSAAVIEHVATHMNWVRPGIMLYGISPLAHKTAAELALQPVMTLRSEIISIRELRKGDPVGYGAIWHCPCDGRIGVVALGYGDGYPRNTPSGTPVLVQDQIVPIVGRVSMDMLTIDLTSQPRAQLGDAVIFWGKDLPAEKIAQITNRFVYELVCGVSSRVPREYKV